MLLLRTAESIGTTCACALLVGVGSALVLTINATIAAERTGAGRRRRHLLDFSLFITPVIGSVDGVHQHPSLAVGSPSSKVYRENVMSAWS